MNWIEKILWDIINKNHNPETCDSLHLCGTPHQQAKAIEQYVIRARISGMNKARALCDQMDDGDFMAIEDEIAELKKELQRGKK